MILCFLLSPSQIYWSYLKRQISFLSKKLPELPENSQNCKHQKLPKQKLPKRFHHFSSESSLFSQVSIFRNCRSLFGHVAFIITGSRHTLVCQINIQSHICIPIYFILHRQSNLRKDALLKEINSLRTWGCQKFLAPFAHHSSYHFEVILRWGSNFFD